MYLNQSFLKYYYLQQTEDTTIFESWSKIDL